MYSSAVKKSVAKKKTTAAPKKRAARVNLVPGTEARARAVKKILLNVEKQMTAAGLKASLGDYMKLLQLSKEMNSQPKTAIRVMWIEEPEEPPIEK